LVVAVRVDLRKPFEPRHAGGPSDVLGCYFASRFEEAI